VLLKTLILGLGNPILGDDGVGWRIIEELRRHELADANDSRTPRLEEQAVEFDCAALSGLSLMERIIGYKRVLLVDAVFIQNLPVGEVVFSNLAENPCQVSGRLASAHDTTLDTALAVGQQLGAQLPDEICIVGVSTKACFDFSETLSPSVAAAVPAAAQLALQWLSYQPA